MNTLLFLSVAVWNCALVRWTARGRRRKQQFEKKTEMCNFSATWFTCQISLPMQPGAAILKKKKELCNFTATWCACNLEKQNPEMCNFSATWCACPISISLPTRPPTQPKKGTVQFQRHLAHLDNFGRLLCNFTAGTLSIVQFHCRLVHRRQLCNFTAALRYRRFSCQSGSCAISMPHAASVQFRCRLVPLELSIVQFLCRLGQQRRLCNFAAAVRWRQFYCQRGQSANSPPPCAAVQFQCQTRQLCNFAAALRR